MKGGYYEKLSAGLNFAAYEDVTIIAFTLGCLVSKGNCDHTLGVEAVMVVCSNAEGLIINNGDVFACVSLKVFLDNVGIKRVGGLYQPLDKIYVAVVLGYRCGRRSSAGTVRRVRTVSSRPENSKIPSPAGAMA